MPTPQTILKDTFGYDTFRPLQLEVIENFLARRDTVALSSASPDQQATAFTAFDELGTALLKPVFDKLNGALNYDELKILRLCFLSQNGKGWPFNISA
jgi:hypothetical protein